MKGLNNFEVFLSKGGVVNKNKKVYHIGMSEIAKKPVFFIATKTHKEPVVVNFYTKTGKMVSFDAVQKVKTKEGVHFFEKSSKR